MNRKRVQRLVRQMGLRALYPKPRTSQPGVGHPVYPYLLRGLSIERPNQVWATEYLLHPDGARVHVSGGHPGLVLAPRPGLAGCRTPSTATSVSRPSRTRSPATGRRRSSRRTKAPQFTSTAFTTVLKTHAVAISMDGKGRWVDNVFVERLCRSVKYEDVYLHAYDTPAALRAGLTGYFQFYNGRRRHRSLGRRTPDVVYFGTNRLRHGGLKHDGDFT